MINFNDKVQYIGKDSPSYFEDGKGKKGRVISEPYQIQDHTFVDVEWFFGPVPDAKAFSRDAHAGHVVNVKNLQRI